MVLTLDELIAVQQEIFKALRNNNGTWKEHGNFLSAGTHIKRKTTKSLRRTENIILNSAYEKIAEEIRRLQ